MDPKNIKNRPGTVPFYDPHGHPHDPVLTLPVGPTKSLGEEFYDSYEGTTETGGSWKILPNGLDMQGDCEHEPVEVGFNISKVVCKKCDRILPGEALYGKKTFQ